MWFQTKMKRFVIVCLLTFCVIYAFITYRVDPSDIFDPQTKDSAITQVIIKVDERNPLTIHCNQGRLGNQMCSYAALHGISSLNQRNMSIMSCNAEKLLPYFEIETPVINEKTFEPRDPYNLNQNYLTEKDLHIRPKTNIIKGYQYPCSYTFFNRIRKNITQDFTFKAYIRDYVQQALLKIKGNQENTTFVGMHVRRTDYITQTKNSWLKAFSGREVDMEFFEKAINYYRQKYSNVIFVVVSDDRKWCRTNLKHLNVHVMDDAPSPAHDLATMSYCNHTIMTYGTFGFWGSYLAGGEVIYFDKFLKPGTNFLKTEFQFEHMYLPEWIGISTNSSFNYTK